MNWKDRYRSFYYQGLVDIPDIHLSRIETALLVIDVQNIYFSNTADIENTVEERMDWMRWAPFRERMAKVVIPTASRMLDYFRSHAMEVFFARIATLKHDGRDRSLSQKRPGFNNILLPKDDSASQIVDALKPLPDEIVVTKTTDSALTGTNLRLVMHNMGIKNVVVVGIFTDQCVSSTVRSLADESFNVVVLDDGCASATDDLHGKELEILNNIYCQVMESNDVISILEEGAVCPARN
ncbi:cysteine hydrolase family protein [Acidithiobacillus sulfuriphilus]|uniref:Cysteine hydrolase n=2 Tax=Acidithiobacillus sulfuriphilus TaxID=1867749 RepID=A0A3M8QP13_9PROT|nr:isochorismatase family cysteine hydrolase [Acidithiobacillus sulfuriphilus]RNF57975.1 cysteine hydrolase [Acidithiobacillus sulfuriphilus]